MAEVELVDEFGVKNKFVLLHTFGMDDENYAVFTQADQSEDEQEIFIMRIEHLGVEEIAFQIIEDEEELEDAMKIYTTLLDEQEK